MSHQNLKCHPSTVSQIHNLLTRSWGKGSYRGCLSPLLLRRHRKEGSQTNYRFDRVTGQVLRQHTSQWLWWIWWYLQYVHNDTYCPTVHRSSVSLPPDDLGSWENNTALTHTSTFFRQTCKFPNETDLPRYSGVPHGSLIRPFSSFASWKSLMTILECFRRLKYTKFSNWMCEEKKKKHRLCTGSGKMFPFLH